MGKISLADVEKAALLSRLKLSPREAELFRGQLSKVLDYIDCINQLDTGGVEPTSHPLPITNVFREDEPRESLSPEEVLSNAPRREGEFFRVKAVLEE